MIRELRKLPHEIGRCLHELNTRFGNDIVFTSSLSKEDQVITHIIATELVPIKVVTLDTGRHFPEFYDLWQRTEHKLGITIQSYNPNAGDLEKYVRQNGINGFYDSIDARKSCCHIRKVEPLQRALTGKKIWITGLRSAQSDHRQSMRRFENAEQIIKYNPLIDWTDQQLDHYINNYNVLVNPLHQKGFVSIGCAPCTRAITEGEHPRAGRWWWESSKKECGLHIEHS